MSERDDDRLDLSAWSPPTPPRGLSNRVMDAVKASGDVDEVRPSTAPRSRSAPLGTGRVGLILAGVTAAAAITWAVWPRARTNVPTSGHVIAGAPSKVALGGGTIALLGAGADLTWQRDGARLAVTQAAGNVTYQHPGPGGLVVTTPLATIHAASASMNVEVPMSNRKVMIAGVGGAAVAAAVVIAVYEGRAEVREPATSPRFVEAGGQVAVAAPPARPSFTPVGKATKDRAQRDALAAAIASARAARTSGAAGGGGGGSMPAGTALTTGPGPGGAPVDLTPGELSKEEIRTSVREVIPLLSECYTLMLDKHPTIGGKVTAKLVVEAEPDLGTIVTMQDDSQIDMRASESGSSAKAMADDLTADLRDFNQCLTATLESVALPPLGDKDGGRVEITYPFIFAPSEEEADQYDDPQPPGPGPTAAQKTTQDPARNTADDLILQAENAAKRSEWQRALDLAHRAAKLTGVPSSRAAVVASLAACNLKKASWARNYYRYVTSGAKNLIRQRCLMEGIHLDAQSSDEVMNPFGNVKGDQDPPRPPRATPPPKPEEDTGDAVLDPFQRR